MNSKPQSGQSDDEFECLKDEVLTVPQPKYSPPKNLSKSNPRIQKMVEKHRVGLVLKPLQTETLPLSTPKRQVQQIKGKTIKMGRVVFRSNFECGSLGGVELVGVNSFKVSMDSESNSCRSNNWFYFIVQGVKGDAQFAITGFKKKSSLYNEGMKLCCREQGELQWRRGGTHIRYTSNNDEDNPCFEVRFKYSFTGQNCNSVQFAYCFPYGLNRLNCLIGSLKDVARIQNVASSFDGRDIPMVNLGNLQSKDVIVLSGRVHPGETVSSFMMEGFLQQITSDTPFSNYLREKFLFKIMPMINVDGVARGNFRFAASGLDLNRRWKQPIEIHHPEIFYLKKMITNEGQERKIRMFIDMHGHSRRKNIFFYGCCLDDVPLQDNFPPKAFPFLMSKIHPPFSYIDSNFSIQEEKAGTARVALWKQLQINQIYTLEASFCSSGKGSNYMQADYCKMGSKLCEGMALYFYQESSQKCPQIEKRLSFRGQVYRELKNDPVLLKHGNQSSTGSESEPEKGQSKQLFSQRREKEGTAIGRRKNGGYAISMIDKKKIANIWEEKHKTDKSTRPAPPKTVGKLKPLETIRKSQRVASKESRERARRASYDMLKQNQTKTDQYTIIDSKTEKQEQEYPNSQPKREKVNNIGKTSQSKNVRVHSLNKQSHTIQQVSKDMQPLEEREVERERKLTTYFRQMTASKTPHGQEPETAEEEGPLSGVDTGMLNSDVHFKPVMPRFHPRLASPDKRRKAVSLSVSRRKGSLGGNSIQPVKMHGTKDHLIRGRQIAL